MVFLGGGGWCVGGEVWRLGAGGGRLGWELPLGLGLGGRGDGGCCEGGDVRDGVEELEEGVLGLGRFGEAFFAEGGGYR